MWVKFGAVLPLAAGGLGLLLCVICGVGVWAANGPINEGVTGALRAAASYAQLAGTSSAAALTLNRSLENANRIPGVDVPTYTEQLQAADRELDEINDELATAAAAA